MLRTIWLHILITIRRFFLFMTYHRVCHKRNTKGDTSWTGTAYQLSSSPLFSGIRVVRSLVFYEVFCRLFPIVFFLLLVIVLLMLFFFSFFVFFLCSIYDFWSLLWYLQAILNFIFYLWIYSNNSSFNMNGKLLKMYIRVIE